MERVAANDSIGQSEVASSRRLRITPPNPAMHGNSLIHQHTMHNIKHSMRRIEKLREDKNTDRCQSLHVANKII
jgi:hypothetical protein